MKVDFHVHSSFNKMNFNSNYTKLIFDTAIKEKLEALVILEHMDSNSLLDLFRFLSENYNQKNDYFQYKNLKVFCGIEISCDFNSHILCISNINDLLMIYGFLSKNKISLEKLLNELSSIRNRILLLGAHPFSEKHYLLNFPNSLLKKLDGLQLNATNAEIFNSRNKQLVEEGFNVVAGSDSHHPILLGSCFSMLNNNCNSILDLKNNICLEHANRISEDYMVKYKYDRLASKALKKLNR